MNETPDLTRLVPNAWLLFKLTVEIEKILLDTFFDQFLDLEEQEELLRDDTQQPPPDTP